MTHHSFAHQALIVELLDNHIALVTINRPDRSNAINAEIARELEQAVESLEANQDVWVVILTGAGVKVFCGGADLKEIAAGRADELHTPEGGFAGFVHAKRAKPWIAAVNGAAVGGGLEIMLACDLVIAADHASFALTEVKRGLIAGAGGLYRLPRKIPENLATEMIITGNPMDARFAKKWGLVNRVTSSDSLLDHALKFADEISKNAPIAIRESLKLIRASKELSSEELYQLNAKCRITTRQSQDYIEGATAYLEKREPIWKGC